MIPRIIPTKESVYDRKLRKKVDSRIFITINNGKITPNSIRINPSKMVLLGLEMNMVLTPYTTNRKQNDLVQAGIPVVLPLRKALK